MTRTGSMAAPAPETGSDGGRIRHLGIDDRIYEEYGRLNVDGSYVQVPELREAVCAYGHTRQALYRRLITLRHEDAITLHETDVRMTGGLFYDCRYYHFIVIQEIKCHGCGKTVPNHTTRRNSDGSPVCWRCDREPDGCMEYEVGADG